ncbi:MAG: hypothetical protein ABIS00_15885 [Gemmatimonadales bacterium]
MTNTREKLLRLLIDPARIEEILGDLEESRGSRAAASHCRDLLSVCVRQSRLRTVPRSLALPLVAALAALVLLAYPAPLQTVLAADDAGTFTIRFAGREVVGATVDGVEVPPKSIRHEGDLVIIPSGSEALRLRVAGAASFVWESRQPTGVLR